MLILKKNILNQDSCLPFDSLGATGFPQNFNPFDFLKVALQEEEIQIRILLKQPPQFWQEDLQRFYPHAYKIGDFKLIKTMVNILLEGLICKDKWFHLNTYHFCLLYDILFRYAFNYNHDELSERIKVHPKWKGELIPLKLFIEEYFFNKVFLIDSDDYNAMLPDEKKLRGFTCPCQFGVINGLRPTHEEMELKESKNFPYTLYV